MIRSFEGKTPKIAESALICETAYIVGDVEIGDNSGIWPGAVVRGDFASIKIGNNTMIEDNSVLHAAEPMEIGDNVTIGHGVVVHGIKIGNDTLIGNSATILNGAQIGSFCVIAAGCVVTPGMKIPDNSFVVGLPAEIKGEISPQRRQLQGGNQFNLKLLKRYKEQGF